MISAVDNFDDDLLLFGNDADFVCFTADAGDISRSTNLRLPSRLYAANRKSE